MVHRLRQGRNPHNETRLHLQKLAKRWHYSIGAYSYGRPRVRYPESGHPLTIGRYCSIASNVQLLMGGNHRHDWVTTYPFAAMRGLWPDAEASEDYERSRGGITIGHDVWLGTGCLILPGITIGHGAVIGANAVVTRDVAPYAIVAGNPARVLRRRFDDATVDALLDAAWWDLPPEAVSRLIPLLSSDRVAELASAARAAHGVANEA
ncbi:acetyltransferase [Methylobacterium brachythecii]|uniref:Acetyltransferase n=1 Tax=Methylobacterium brachythecii TaxID=1176177 RepID=A0ABQ6D7E8_9HYPH|nr:acetyltransferase [Methylobacterium brachythecii]